MFEAEGKKSISLEKRDEKLAIFIPGASFSYAEIPYQFSRILGVTGTLQTLTPF